MPPPRALACPGNARRRARAPGAARAPAGSTAPRSSRSALWPRAQLDVERALAAAALDANVDLVADLVLVHDLRDLAELVDRLAVDRDDDVAGLQAGGLGRATGRHVGDLRAGGRYATGDVGGCLHAEEGMLDALALLEDRDDLAHGVRRDGEADADVAVAGAARLDLRVHADDATGVVEQRAARVAGVDRRVRLDRLVDLEAVGSLDAAPEPGDDALGRRAVQPERVADRDRRVADLDGARVGQRQRLGGLGCAAGLKVDDREVARCVDAEDLAVEVGAVGAEAHRHVLGRVDDVGIRDDRLRVVDEEARSRAGAGADRDDGRHGLRIDRAGARLALARID